MAYRWITTKHTGLRYREHPTRKHGIKKDRFYQYRHTADGKRLEESLGWWSKGWSELKCLEEIVKIEAAKRTGGAGPVTLKEKRKAAAVTRKEEARSALSVADVWEKTAPGRGSYVVENGYFKTWIKPVIGDKYLKDVATIHLERIKSNMEKAGRAPRTVQYVLSLVRRLFNDARRLDLFVGDNPAAKVRKPKFDNRRQRFLTKEEAAALLKELQRRSKQTHDITLLSLYTGMRAGEVFALTWADIDLPAGRITVRETKSGKTRFSYMAAPVKAMFRTLSPGAPGDLVFPDMNGKKIVAISQSFNRAVAALKLNKDIPLIDGKKPDRRFKVVFHTIRHTFASWLVQDGTDLFTVKELLGHSDFAMTSRYSHLAPDTLQAAISRLDRPLPEPEAMKYNGPKQTSR